MCKNHSMARMPKCKRHKPVRSAPSTVVKSMSLSKSYCLLWQSGHLVVASLSQRIFWTFKRISYQCLVFLNFMSVFPTLLDAQIITKWNQFTERFSCYKNLQLATLNKHYWYSLYRQSLLNTQWNWLQDEGNLVENMYLLSVHPFLLQLSPLPQY